MDLLTIVQLTSYATALVILISFPIKKKNFNKKNGECQLELKRTTGWIYPTVIILSIVMLVLLYFREFALYMVIVLHATDLLALEMSTRELVYRSNAGIYSDFIIVEGRKLEKEEIYSLPTLQYEEEYNNTLEVVTEKKGTMLLIFADNEERSAAVEILRTWVKK